MQFYEDGMYVIIFLSCKGKIIFDKPSANPILPICCYSNLEKELGAMPVAGPSSIRN